MPPNLSHHEQRVLGCLLEKEVLTPEVYPMTLNGLRVACNQRTSREPVLDLDDNDVSAALNLLKGKDLATARMDSRATKYQHSLAKVAALAQAERAVLTLLLLRGAQTIGELRSRAERLHSFNSPAEVEESLEALSQRLDGPWTQRLPRRPGEKEARWVHRLDGGTLADAQADAAVAGAENPVAEGLAARVQRLEDEVALLKRRLDQA
ncbi:MAG TPA: YceH family protein [bacterium]|nr:YceH family protein [bacterium]